MAEEKLVKTLLLHPGETLGYGTAVYYTGDVWIHGEALADSEEEAIEAAEEGIAAFDDPEFQNWARKRTVITEVHAISALNG